MDQGIKGDYEQNVPGQQIRNRRKEKCSFSPNRRSGAPLLRTNIQHDNTLPPPQVPAPDRQRPDWSKCANLMPSTSDQLEHLAEVDESGTQSIAPCRVTLMPPGIRRRSPFARYFRPQPDPLPLPDHPQLNPNRVALQRLGLSEETLDSRINAEVDELLQDMRAERQLARIMPASSDIPRSSPKRTASLSSVLPVSLTMKLLSLVFGGGQLTSVSPASTSRWKMKTIFRFSIPTSNEFPASRHNDASEATPLRPFLVRSACCHARGRSLGSLSPAPAPRVRGPSLPRPFSLLCVDCC